MATIFNVSNQAPYTFNPLHITPPLQAQDVHGNDTYLHHSIIENLATKHLLNPINSQQPVTVTYADDAQPGNTHDIDADFIARAISRSLVHPNDLSGHTERNRTTMTMLSKLTQHVGFDQRFVVDQLFVSQSLRANRLPAPSSGVVYTVSSDIIPAAKDILNLTARMNNPLSTVSSTMPTTADVHSAYDLLFASIAATYLPETYGAIFLNDAEYQRFVEFALGQATTLHTAGLIDDLTMGMFQSLTTVSLSGLTADLMLRKDHTDTTADYSFPRTLISFLHSWVEQEHTQAQANNTAPPCVLAPFSVNQWIMPETLILINAEQHAHSAASDINKNWTNINDAVSGGIRIMSPNAISKLKSAQQISSDIIQQATKARRDHKQAEKRAASENDFSTTEPTPQQLILAISEVIAKLAHVRQSHNPQKYRKKTLTRASRRHPNNPNIPGKVTAKKYLPDLHLYVDTSGSISIESYRNAVVMIMQLCAKLDINLYFSTFSDVLSEELLLPTAGKTPQQNIALLAAIPKVTGGTDFHQIWEYINASPQRQERMNLVLTDFGFTPYRSRNIKHPSSIFYAPIIPGGYTTWESVRSMMTEFSNAMTDFDPYIHSRLIGVHK